MLVKKTFEEWLQEFDSGIHIEEIEQQDVDVLYYGEQRLGSVPKGLKKSRFWTDIINDKRHDSGYTTSDGIAHRSLSGVGLLLLGAKAINEKQFVDNFTTERNKALVAQFLKKRAGLI